MICSTALATVHGLPDAKSHREAEYGRYCGDIAYIASRPVPVPAKAVSGEAPAAEAARP